MWLTPSLSNASYFAEVFMLLGLYMFHVNVENSTTFVLIRRQTKQVPHELLDCFKGVVPKESSSRVWSSFIIAKCGFGKIP